MNAVSRKAVAGTALIALALFAAVPLARGGHHARAERSDVASIGTSVMPRLTQEAFELRWHGGAAPLKIQERAATEGAGPSPARQPATAPIAVTRVASGKGDRLVATVTCAGQAWPYLDPDCVAGDPAAAPRPRVRTITLEQRPDDATSVLARMPVTTVSQR